MSEDSRLGNRAVLILAAFPEWHDRDRISATARYIGPALIASPSRVPMIRQEELLSFQSVVRVANAPAFSALFLRTVRASHRIRVSGARNHQ